MLWFGTSTLHQWFYGFLHSTTLLCWVHMCDWHCSEGFLPKVSIIATHAQVPAYSNSWRLHSITDLSAHRCQHTELMHLPHVFLPKSTRDHCSCICHARMPQTIFCCHFWQKPCCLTLQSIATMTTVLQCLPITNVLFQSWVLPPPIGHRESSLTLQMKKMETQPI